MKRRLSRAARWLPAGAAILVLAMAATSVLAQGDGPSLSSAGQAWSDWATRADDAPDIATRERVRAGEREAQARRDAERAAQRSGATKAMTGLDGVAAATGRALGALGASGDDALRGAAEAARAQGHERTQRVLEQIREALRAAGLLVPGDADSEPSGVPDGQPGVPASCADNPACQQCWVPATERLDQTRLRLEKLRAIYASTYRRAKAQIAFADGVSAVHGVSALAWQRNKIDVLKSLKNLDQVYDTKYAELMRALMDDMQGISRCEEQVMKVPDWYDRFGFVYYLFMKDRYVRPTL